MTLAHRSGWITRIVHLKQRSFLTLVDDSGEHRLVVEGTSCVNCATGDHVTAAGQLQRHSYGAPPEILVETLAINARGQTTFDRTALFAWLQRRRWLRAQGAVLHTLRTALASHGFLESTARRLVGAEATLGASRPFVATLNGGVAYLPVNHIAALIETQVARPSRRFSIGKLFWQHPYGNRYSLSEINTLDLAAPGLDAASMMDLIDDVLLEAQHAVGGGAIPREPPPRLMFSDAATMLALGESEHALSIGAGHRLAQLLLKPAFWITRAPANASPYYTRIDPVSGGGKIAESFEFWVADVPNVVAGSVWSSSAEMLNIDCEASLVARQRKLIEANLPAGAGATIGFDRLMMALLSTDNVRDVLLHARTPKSFRPIAPIDNAGNDVRDMQAAAPSDLHDHPEQAAIDDSVGLRQSRAIESLAAIGFVEVRTSAVTPPSESGISIDWYGRSAAAYGDSARLLAAHIAAGLTKVACATAAQADGGEPHPVISAMCVIDTGESAESLRAQFAGHLGMDVRVGVHEPGALSPEASATAFAAMPRVAHIMIDLSVAEWRCSVCGYRCKDRPRSCPVCHADEDAFVPSEAQERA